MEKRHRVNVYLSEEEYELLKIQKISENELITLMGSRKIEDRKF